MKVITGNEKKPAYPGCFSGVVFKEGLKSAVTPTEPEISIFHYHAGAISKWHSHPGGQSLFVLSDSAMVGDEKGGVTRVSKGDLIVTQPGERHFHGAEHDQEADLLTLTFGVTRWGDDFPELT